MIDEQAFTAAMGNEVEDMPHDFDSLEDWARDFLSRYEAALKEATIGDMEQAGFQNILGYELVLTCGACPEQYDVFKDGKKVAYLRLRHGSFTCDVPECMGETIYTASPGGDGEFYDSERRRYLTEAIRAVADYYSSRDTEK